MITHLRIKKIVYYILEFSVTYYVSPKKNVKYFSSITYCKLKFVYVVVVPSIVKSQLSLKLPFCDILRMICHIDFTCRSINFLRQRKQQTKYQKLGVVSLIPREEGPSEPRQTYKTEHFTKIDND